MTPLRLRMIEDMRIRNLSQRTQTTYVEQVARFARHFGKSPELLGPAEIRSWRLHLAENKRLAASSISVTVAALRFLYTVTLRQPWVVEDDIPTGRRPQKLPNVLSPEEVAAFLDAVENQRYRAILAVCYAAGLRVSEAVRLKPAAIDSRRMVIRVEAGKGRKDRYVMLSPRLLAFSGIIGRRPIRENGCFRASGLASRSPDSRSSAPVGRHVSDPGSRGRSPRILCAMRLRSICWRPAPICAPSSCCLVIAA